jgi:hypothetical protein
MPSPSIPTVALQEAFNLSISVVAILLFRSITINSHEVLGVNSIPSIHAIGLLDINFGYEMPFLLENVIFEEEYRTLWCGFRVDGSCWILVTVWMLTVWFYRERGKALKGRRRGTSCGEL